MHRQIRFLLEKMDSVYRHAFLIFGCLLLLAIALFGAMDQSFAEAPQSDNSQRSGKAASAIKRLNEREGLHKRRKEAAKRFRAAWIQKALQSPYDTTVPGNIEREDNK